MMRIEITDDRLPARRRTDPVVAREGVFADLPPEALSATEITRSVRLAEAVEKQAQHPLRLWRVQDVLKHLTQLYARFTNPFRRKADKP